MIKFNFFRNLFFVLFTIPGFTQLSTNECMENLSIFAESAKIKNYQAAYEPWKIVIDNCPKLNVATYQFGENSDVYSGAVSSDFINTHSFSEIQKVPLRTTSPIQSTPNGIKLFLEAGDLASQVITGVQTGSFANVELTNNVDQTYKVVKKSQVETNLFRIEAMQYDIEKFQKIEQDDYDDTEITYNIGIPNHTVNRPSEPTVNFTLSYKNNGAYSVSGTITAAAGSNETSYRVSVFSTSSAGAVVQREFLRVGNSTPFEINGLSQEGVYDVFATALRNPESSSSFKSTFTIEPKKEVWLKPIIKKICIYDDDLSNYYRQDGTLLEWMQK